MQTVTISRIHTHIERGVITVHKAAGFFVYNEQAGYFIIEFRGIMDNIRTNIEMNTESDQLFWDLIPPDKRQYIYNRMLIEMRKKLFQVMI